MNPTNDSNSTAGNAPAFSPGALRAAHEMFPNCDYSTVRDAARCIDRQTGARELLNRLQGLLRSLEELTDGQIDPANGQAERDVLTEIALSRAAIAKAEGRA